ECNVHWRRNRSRAWKLFSLEPIRSDIAKIGMTSPNQQLVFVGSYAAPSQSGIYAFSFDDTTGNLTAIGAFAGIANPSFLVVHPTRRCLYAVSETSQQNDGAPGSVWSLRFAHQPWSIQPLNHQLSGGDWPCHLQLDTTGRWLFVSNYGTGSVGVLPI